MGNSPMTIGLKVDKSGAVSAGSTIYGRIYVSSSQESKSNACHSIQLKVIGTEEFEIHHANSVGTRTQDYYERSSHTIYSVNHTIKEFPTGTIPRGQYEYPFALQLPSSLPSSMSARNGKSNCKVKYEVVAEIFQKHNSRSHTNPNAKERLTIMAIAPVTSIRDTSLSLPIEEFVIHNCSCCCFMCCKHGTVALETKFHQNFHSGTAHVHFRCDNKSTKKFQSIRVSVSESIDWSTNGYIETSRKTLAKVTRDVSMYPELTKSWRKPYFWERQRQGSDSDQHLPMDHKPWGTIELPMGEITANATDTYNGRKVRVRHIVTLGLICNDFCSTNPEASAMVEIYRRPMEGAVSAPGTIEMSEAYYEPFQEEPEAQLVLPEDWNATTADIMTIPIAQATVLDS